MKLFAFIYGFLAAAAALLIEVGLSVVFDMSPTGFLPLSVLIVSALIEESAKLVFLFQLGRRKNALVELSHAVWFGLGFAATEFSLLFAGHNFPTESALPFPLPLLGVALIHVLTATLLYGGLRFREAFPASPALALLAATGLHAFYNWFQHSLASL